MCANVCLYSSLVLCVSQLCFFFRSLNAYHNYCLPHQCNSFTVTTAGNLKLWYSTEEEERRSRRRRRRRGGGEEEEQEEVEELRNEEYSWR